MKNFKFILFIAVAAIFGSCSSDSNSGSDTPNAFAVNGTNVTLSSTIAQKSENTIAIIADATDGSSIEVTFNKFGDLQRFSYYDANFNSYRNFQYFKSNYFNFDLVSINESSKRVKVTFSGTLYENENDLNSNSQEISGSFDLPYIVQTPIIAGLELSCKIAGNNWYDTDFWDNGFGDVDRKFISDDENMIIMRLTEENIAIGTYNFTTNTNNRFQLAKYNTTTNQYVEYDTAGTLTITSNSTPFFGIRVVEGTFSFVATNPSNSSDQVQITNGVFKTNF
jgi:hypothetical protein